MPSYLKKKSQWPKRLPAIGAVLVIVLLAVWLFYPNGEATRDARAGEGQVAGNNPATGQAEPTNPQDGGLASATPDHPMAADPSLSSVRGGEHNADAAGDRRVDNPGELVPADNTADPRRQEKALRLVNKARLAMTQEDWLQARGLLNQAWQLGIDGAEQKRVRGELIQLADATLMGSSYLRDDPLVDRYLVKTGDNLGKIAKGYDISDDLIARVNDLRNKNLIRVGQNLKVLRGPFSAEVDTETFSMYVYLGQGKDRVLVRYYRVGLGRDGGTPTGVWRVKNKLTNPTYYPARGGKIIAADDPNNPLGDRWIGLEGIEGEAVGQSRYGIHGTNEPDSIGKDKSLGCVRLLNKNVEEFFDLVCVKKSKITIR